MTYQEQLRKYMHSQSPTSPDRWVRDPQGGMFSEAIWNDQPTEGPPEGHRFVFKADANGFVLVNNEDDVITTMIHQEIGPYEYVMGLPA